LLTALTGKKLMSVRKALWGMVVKRIGISSIDYVAFLYYFCAVMEWLNTSSAQQLGGFKVFDPQQTFNLSLTLDIGSCK